MELVVYQSTNWVTSGDHAPLNLELQPKKSFIKEVENLKLSVCVCDIYV